jgi:hypothetical protein
LGFTSRSNDGNKEKKKKIKNSYKNKIKKKNIKNKKE